MKVHALGRTVSQIAIAECVGELRAACRRPIDPIALDEVVERMRPNFEKILDRIDGGKRWADHGQRLRENSRHLGAFADFFAHHHDVEVVGEEELGHAVAMMRADCTTRGERTPLGFEYCTPPPPKNESLEAAEAYLRALTPELATVAG